MALSLYTPPAPEIPLPHQEAFSQAPEVSPRGYPSTACYGQKLLGRNMKQVSLILAIALSSFGVSQGTTFRKLSLSGVSAAGRRILLVDIKERKIEEKIAPHGMMIRKSQLIGVVAETIRGGNLDQNFDVSDSEQNVCDWGEARKFYGDDLPEQSPHPSLRISTCEVGKRYLVIYIWKRPQPFCFEVSKESNEWRKELSPHVPDSDESPE